MQQDNCRIQDNMKDPVVYLESSEPDTMYFDQDMRKPERKEFINATIREVSSHCELNHLKLLPRKEAPKGQPILDLV